MGQNPILEESLIEIRLGSYGVAAASALKDPAPLADVRNYKRQVASRMMPLSFEDISRKVPDANYHVSRKIDGEFCVLVFDNGNLATVNPGGTVRTGLPWQIEAKKILSAAGVKHALIAGELYAENDDGRRPRVHDVVSVARQPKSEPELDRIRFAVFDLISIDGESQQTPYGESWHWIESTFGGGTLIQPVETVILKGHRDVEQQFRKWVEEQGAEGLVVRSPSAGNFKIKPRHNLDAVVIGFTESTDDRQGMLHDLLLGVARHDGSVQVLCRVGGGFTDENRREMLSDLQDRVVESEYAEVNSDHVAYQMVQPAWVIEISCLDMIAQNTRGGPVNRMVLNWNPAESRYEVVRRLPLVSVISPQFVRLRADKQFDTSDVRIDQISSMLPIHMVDIDARQMKMAASTLLERDVYTKQLRGEILVRKFLLWKTNKANESNDYPAFVTAYVDFSPSRKTPLTREVRVSNSESQVRALFGEFKEANVKKGWELHSSQSRSGFVNDEELEKENSDRPEKEKQTGGNQVRNQSQSTAEKPRAANKSVAKGNKNEKTDGKVAPEKIAKLETTPKKTSAKKTATKIAAKKKTPGSKLASAKVKGVESKTGSKKSKANESQSKKSQSKKSQSKKSQSKKSQSKKSQSKKSQSKKSQSKKSQSKKSQSKKSQSQKAKTKKPKK